MLAKLSSNDLNSSELCSPRRVCFRLFLSYLGGEFCGFQAQANGRSVASELSFALRSIVKDEPVLRAAGRTDSGVHARGQVVSLDCTTRLTEKQFILALASKLPKDISVWRIDRMPIGFDARRHSVGKRYVYRIYQGLVPDPFLAAFALHVRGALDVLRMIEASKSFIGEHDFSSFRASACTASHARRYIWHMGINKTEDLLEIDIRGNAFCMNMVRIMVGTLIQVGQKRRSPESIAALIKACDRRLAGITAKAHGLTLEEVYYPDNLSSAAIPLNAQFPRYPVTAESWGF